MLGMEKRVEQRSKQLESKLPSLPSKDTEKNAIEYVALIYEGMDKADAFKQVFPDNAQNAIEFARSHNRDERAMIKAKAITYEKGKYVSKLFNLGRDEYWKRWIHKKTKALETAYDRAMDDSKSDMVQMRYLKLFLDSVPDMKEEQVINVKHHIGSDAKFMENIKARQEALLNGLDSIIDAELSED